MTPPRLFVVPAALLALTVLAMKLRMNDSSYYEITPAQVAFIVAGALVVGLGALGVSGDRNLRVALLALVATVAVLFGAISSLAIVLLPLGAALLILLFVALAGRRSAKANTAALGGAGMALGLAALVLSALQPPRVYCTATGGGTSSGGLFDAQARSGSGSSTVDGAQTGRIEYADEVVTFECRDGRLVKFERARR